MTLLKIVVTLGAVALVLRTASPARIGAIMLQVDPLWLGMTAVATLLQLLAHAWRWQLVHQALSGVRVGFGPILRGFCRGTLFGQPLPSGVGSDAIRVVAMARDMSLISAVRSVVCDRLLGLAALLLIVGATLPLFAMFVDHGPAYVGLAITTVGGLGVMAVLVIMAGHLGRVPVIGRVAPYVGGDLRVITRAPSGGMSWLLAAVSHVLSVAMFAAAARSVGDTTPLLLVALIVLPVLSVASLPVSLGGWGVREAVIATAYGMIGGVPAAGVSASIIFGLSSPIVSAGIELAYVLFGRRADKRGKAASGAA